MSGINYFFLLILIILILTSFKKTRNFLKQFSAEFLTGVSTIGLTIIGIMSNSDKIFVSDYTWKDAWIYLLLLFAVMIFASIVIGAIKSLENRTFQSLNSENIKLQKEIKSYKVEYYKLCSNNIYRLFNSFYTSGGERISIYKHQGDHFILLGRYAKNPAFNKYTDYQYSENEGLIGQGWNNGEALITGAPKWTKSGKEYKKFMRERCTISDKRLRTIRMKSRSLFANTLNDESTAENPDGIIVFESTEPNKVTKGECLDLISTKKDDILTLLKNMTDLMRKTE